jgi:hypothetical protein
VARRTLVSRRSHATSVNIKGYAVTISENIGKQPTTREETSAKMGEAIRANVEVMIIDVNSGIIEVNGRQHCALSVIYVTFFLLIGRGIRLLVNKR